MGLKFITGNPHKFSEAKQIISDIEQIKIDLDEIQSMDAKEIIEHKLNQATSKVSGELFCEDVSLCIKSLNNFPGPFVKWWNKSCPAEKRVEQVMLFSDRSAEVICTIGYSNGETVEFFEGIIKGKIVMPRGESSFGFDPIFEVEDSGKTFAEMSSEEKNLCSHRSVALAKLKEFLDNKK